MSYREQLIKLKQQKSLYQKTMSNIYNRYGNIMTDDAMRQNKISEEMYISFMDRQIQQLEPLAIKEIEQEIVQKVSDSISVDTSKLSETLTNSISDIFDNLKL